MGMIVSVLRNAELGDCTNGGITSKVDSITVTNIDGPFEPTPERPAFKLIAGPLGNFTLVPEEQPEGVCGPMMGGNYGATSDSRFSKRIGFYGAVPIHDRFETWEQYERLSR